MCGIIGYVGNRPVRDILVDGLEKLEYRGYDSAGVALQVNGRIESVRAVGNLSALRTAAQTLPAGGPAKGHAAMGIGHTRWATHGRVTEANAHPHFDSSGRVHIVLNGIIENYRQLRADLQQRGCTFTSETDAEVVAHLIAEHYAGDLRQAVSQTYQDLQGHYAFVAMSASHPGLLVAARNACPLLIGSGQGEVFVASALPAFLQHTKAVQYVENGEIVTLTADGAKFWTVGGESLQREVVTVDWDTDTAEKCGFETFMLKEIYEQPTAVAETLAGCLDGGLKTDLGDLGVIDDDFLAGMRRIIVVACGTSYHAGLVGRYAIEQWARVPVEMDIASEFRYRSPIVDERDLVLGITQSGETADTLAAMSLARARGAKVLAVTNIMGSQATRDADAVLFTRAGLEIGVAATKTFVAQVAAMYLLALHLAAVRGALPKAELARLIGELDALPSKLETLLESSAERMEKAAADHYRADFFLYLGRNIGLPVALEGALKLKEISYIATDAYAAGEMKHGPIALLDDHTPVVCVATDSPVLDKMISNMEEVQARGAHVIAVATEGNATIAGHAEETIFVPATDWVLQPLLAIVPLQLLAYYIAKNRGLNVDQPRNLAKTVTVE